MTQTTAKLTRAGKHFEILVDLDEALKIRKGQGSISSAVLTNEIFHNLKAGDIASDESLMKVFETNDFEIICTKIIKNGEVQMPVEYMHKEQEQKYKQVVDFLVKNTVSPSGIPYTPDRIMKSLKEAHVNVKNKPIDSQVNEIIDALSKILPLKIERKNLKITIPAQHTGKAYGLVNEFKKKEEWLSNGDLVVYLEIPAGLEMDFYDKLNAITHGSALSEEINKSY